MNAHKRWFLLVVGLWAWLWLACTSDTVPRPDPCTSDAGCPDGQVCHEGWCRDGCTTSADCPANYQCISGACLVACSADNDCPAGQRCREGFCEPRLPEDGGDGDGDAGPPQCIDNDGDGHGDNCLLGTDCDDNDPTSYEGAQEKCADGKDNDCDGQTDEADCGCQPGTSSACYDGDPATRGVGECRSGIAICQPDKTYGPCVGQVLPAEEQCNGRDDDCDGTTDEGLLNSCGTCGDVPPEQCGDGLDNNCDGQVDENCQCDPDCQCDQAGAGQQCTCHPPTHQPCYSGPPGTLGFGICRGGYHDCVEQPDGSWAWSSCQGEVVPGTECAGGQANNEDDDCDGATDEDCLPDGDGDGYSPPADCNDGDPDIHPGASESCNGRDDDCNGLIDEGVSNACGACGPVPDEVCGDGLDNDCDGLVDEGCGGCGGQDARPCYRGPDGTQGVGRCAWGEMVCIDGEFWSECTGDVLPEPEVCDGADNDCDGETDEAGAIGANACGFCDATEVCDGEDNDCDGLTDEGLRNYCGACIGCSDIEPCTLPDTACDAASGLCAETACDGVDNDCDGLTDEGLLNACGTCGDSCYQQGWDGQDDWPFGSSDGVSNSADPDELRLDSTTQSPHYIWIAGTNVVCNAQNGCLTDPGCYPGTDCHTVRKFDTRTNQLIGVYSSWGWSPSRTAVAVDNTVWVGNRGCHDILSNCEADNPQHGNAVHLDADGNLICRADVTGSGVAVRAVTIDADGNAWLGSWGGGHIYKYSGSEVQDNPDGTPRCVQLCDVDLQGSRAYGAAVDGNGYLWISTLGSGPLRKINTADCTIVDSPVDPGLRTYGIAIDQNNNVWLGNWSGGATAVIRVDGQTGAVSHFGRTAGDTSGGRTRGVAVDQENNIWVAEWDHNSVDKFAPDGTHLGQYPLGAGASGPLGMAVDFDDNIWAIAYSSGHASKYDLNGNLLATFPVGGNPYTYSDMTGYQLRTVTLKHGTWTVDYDSGYDGARWDRLEWSGSLASDDKIRVRARSAATEGALAAATWSPYHDADPNQPPPWSADISAEVPPGRWIQVEVTLETQDEVSPAFTGLQVFWQR